MSIISIIEQMKHTTDQLCRNIRLLREYLGISQDEMAERLGMSRSGYSRLERGEVGIDEQRLARIAKVLGVTGEKLRHLDLAEQLEPKAAEELKSTDGSTVQIMFKELHDLFKERIKDQKEIIDSLKEQLESYKGRIEKLNLKNESLKNKLQTANIRAKEQEDKAESLRQQLKAAKGRD